MADEFHWYLDRLGDYHDRVALVCGGDEYTYGQISQQVGIYSEIIKNDFKPGSVVAILSDYSFHSIALFLSLLQHECIIVPVTTSIEDEIQERMTEAFVDVQIKLEGHNHYSPAFLSSGIEKHDLITDIVNKNHAGLILFSSGSTGKAKAMIHDLDVLCSVYESKKPKKLSMMIFLMFDHIGGLNTLLNCMAMGAKMVIPSSREPSEVGALIEQNNVRILPASPTFLNLLLMSSTHQNYDLSSLRMITYGTETMPESLLLRLKKAFPKVRFLQTFGTSETGIAQTSSKSSESTYMKIDDPNLEYKIVENELWLKSKTQISGYLNASMSAFTEDGWFMTGDLVETTEDGYIKIIGRSKEMINVGGEKVLPSEVESVLLQMEAILDCMVYSQKNAIMGQSVAADVVTKEILTNREAKKMVRKFCMGKIDTYKIPTTINVVTKTNFGSRFKKMRITDVRR
ncbi:MAG: o-succinylbenzoate--CoA ligase [Alphaproteobacteria bacterium]|nr:MAG: o-succinylbenzoate--CoA ligase [Alphaproteobacteria bacterium]